MAQLIDCRTIREKVLEEVRGEVAQLPTQPHLAVVIVGDDGASHTYVKNKEKTCGQVGIKSTVIKLPKWTTQEELETTIRQLNWHSEIHGILLQLPLPKHLDEQRAIDLINPNKDVDGLTIHNQGLLALGRIDEAILPCTPYGVIRIFDEIGYDLEGKEVVVVGRSNLFGKPMGQLCLSRNATITHCHSKSGATSYHMSEADVAIIAIGKAKMFDDLDFRATEVVIDVGINRDDSGKLCGDVDTQEVLESGKNIQITPVPSGVGLLTTAMLMKNVVKCYLKQNSK